MEPSGIPPEVLQKMEVMLKYPQFEATTMVKEGRNPLFSFLVGGQYSEYYMWRKRQAGLLPAAANHVPPPPLPSSFNAAGGPLPTPPPPPPPPIQGATERSSRWDHNVGNGASQHNRPVPGSTANAGNHAPPRSRSPSPRRHRSRSRSPRRQRSRSGSWGADKTWPSREERRASTAAAVPPPPPPPPSATMGLSMGGWVGQQVAAAAAAANLNLNSNLNASADGGGRGTVDATIMGNSDTAPGAWGGEMHAEWQTRGGTAGENGEDVLAANPASPSSDAGGGGKQAAAMAQTACSTLVKGLLRSLWKEGVVSRDVFKTICKKVVEKVVSAIPASGRGSLAANEAVVAAFIAQRKPRIKTLVLSYLDKYKLKHPDPADPEWQ